MRTRSHRKKRIAPEPRWNPKLLRDTYSDARPMEPLKVPSADITNSPLDEGRSVKEGGSAEEHTGEHSTPAPTQTPDGRSGSQVQVPYFQSHTVPVPRITPRRDATEREKVRMNNHRFSMKAPRRLVDDIGVILSSNRLDKIQTSTRKT